MKYLGARYDTQQTMRSAQIAQIDPERCTRSILSALPVVMMHRRHFLRRTWTARRPVNGHS